MQIFKLGTVKMGVFLWSLLIISITYMVPKAGFEPAQVSPPPPQDGVSTNSTTSALIFSPWLVESHQA